MIDIRNAAGQRLMPIPGQTLTVESAAGWLTDDELPGAKSYPIRFPLAPNEGFVRSGYRPDNARPVMELPVVVRMEGIVYRRCLLSYRVNEGMGEGYLKIDGGEVFSALRKLTLSDALPDAVELGTSAFKTLPVRMGEIARMKPGEFPCTFFPVRNEGFFEADLTETKLAGFVRQPYVNAWGKLADGTWGFKTDTASVKGYPVSPQFYLTWVLEQIFARASYRMEGDWLADPEVQQLVILNQTALSMHVSGGFFPNSHRALPGQHLPKKSVGDFLKAIRQRYSLQFDFDGNRQVVTIRQFRAVAASPPQDLSAYVLAKAGRARYGIESGAGKGFSVQDAIDAGDELYRNAAGETIQPAPFVIDGAMGSAQQETVNLSVGTTQLIDEPSPGVATTPPARWVVPTVRQPGNMLDEAYAETDRYPEVRAGKLELRNEVALRLLSYRGLVSDSGTMLYPLGTPDVRNGRQELIGTASTTLGGRYGLWRRALRMFYYFRDQTRPVTVSLLMPVTAVVNLKLHEPIALRLDGQVRRTYLINRLLAESPGGSGLMAVKLSALSLPDGLELSSDVDEPVVWIELIVVRAEHFTLGERIVDGYVSTVTLKAWADQTRTSAVVVSNLPVILRRRQSWKRLDGYYPPELYQETLKTYFVSGSAMVIESEWLTQILCYEPSQDANGIRSISFALDPGDDYNIIR